MVIDNTGGMGPADRAGRLQNALAGNPIRQLQPPRPRSAEEASHRVDRATLADQLEVTLRTTNQNFQRIQNRIVSNQITAEALGELRDEIASLRETLQSSPDEPINNDLVSQTIRNINRVADNARFGNVALLDEFTAEGLRLDGIEPEMRVEQVTRALEEADARIEGRLEEVREEDAVDRRELRAQEISLENVAAAMNTERSNAAQEIEANLRSVLQEIPRRGGGDVNLTPDRVLELI